MCRNIRPLFNYEPPSTPDDVREAALQFVRKVSGSTKPSQANQEAFDTAVDDITAITEKLLASLVTNAPPRNRDEEIAKKREQNLQRFG